MDKRGHYDRFGNIDGGVGPFSATDITGATEFFDALFGDLFGIARRKSAQGRDFRYTLELDFEEAALGCEKAIVFERPEDCGACAGTGARGLGRARHLYPLRRRRGDPQEGGVPDQPSRLHGVRRNGARSAGALHGLRRGGAGRSRAPLRGADPPASTGGSTQRVPREGAPGRRGGPSGDLHVIMRVRPHPFYSREGTRDGDVLIVEVPLSLVEATLGADIEVPVLDGRVRMKVPPGTQGGTQFRLRGKGFPRASGVRGDAHVRVVVETPAAVSPEARALLEQVEAKLTDEVMPRRAAFRAAAAPRTDGRDHE